MFPQLMFTNSAMLVIFRLLGLAVGTLLGVLYVHKRWIEQLSSRAEENQRALQRYAISLLAPMESRHAICLEISCERFGVLPPELERTFTDTTCRLSSLRKYIAEMQTTARPDEATLEVRKARITEQAEKLLSRLDTVARFHAQTLGWEGKEAGDEPWEFLEIVCEQRRLRKSVGQYPASAECQQLKVGARR